MISRNNWHDDTNPGVSKTRGLRTQLGQTRSNTGINQIRGINVANATGSGIPAHVTNVSTSIANAQSGVSSTVTVTFRRDPGDKNFAGVTILAKGYQGNQTPTQVGRGSDSPVQFILSNTGESLSIAVQAYGNGGSAPLSSAPTVGISLPKSSGGGTGTTTTVTPPVTSGTASAGQLAKFSSPATTLTGADLSGDVVTSGSIATTVQKVQGTAVTSSTPKDGDVLRYSMSDGSYIRVMDWDWYVWAAGTSYSGTWPFVSVTSSSSGTPWSTSGTVALQNGTTTDTVSTKFTCSLAAGVQSAGLTFPSNVTNAVLSFYRRVRFKVKLGQTTNTRIWIGLATNPQSATTFQSDTPNTAFIGFRYSSVTPDAKWQCITQTDNTHQTKNAETTASHIDTSNHFFDIVYDGSQVTFFIDDVQVGQQSGNLPASTTAVAPAVILDNVVTGNASNMFWYYMKGTLNPTVL